MARKKKNTIVEMPLEEAENIIVVGFEKDIESKIDMEAKRNKERIQITHAKSVAKKVAKRAKRKLRSKTPLIDVKQPASQPIMAEATPPPPVIEKPKSGRNVFMLGVAGGICLIGIVIGWFWMTTANIVLGVLCMACLAGGIWLFRRYWNLTMDRATVIIDKAPVPKQQVNSLNIYADRIVFEDMAKPEGQPWQCVNDGKHYFVHIEDKDGNRLKAFALPDQQYYDPRVFAERVLELPAHRRIFRRKQNLFQKLSPFLLLVAIIIVWILIITTTGGGD